MREHKSDCARHSEPAYPAGDCNCNIFDIKKYSSVELGVKEHPKGSLLKVSDVIKNLEDIESDEANVLDNVKALISELKE